MKRFSTTVLLAVAGTLLCSANALGGWVITYPDTTIDPNSTVEYQLYGEWDLGLAALTVPTVVRAIDPGAFWTGTLPVDTTGGTPTNIQWNWAVPNWANIIQEFRVGIPSGCPAEGDLGYDGVSPDHFIISTQGLSNEAPAPFGRHFLTMVFTVTGTAGQFEFDTACFTTFLNTIYMIDANYKDHGCFTTGLCDLVFNKGTITIASGCNCSSIGDCNTDLAINPADVVYLINYALRNGPAPPTDIACPAINRGDWDCDDRVNLADIVKMINFVFRYPAPEPCDPCHPDDSFIYPLQIGNRWDYSGSMVFFNFQPDSLGDFFPDTFYASSTVEILRRETLHDTLETYVFHETFTLHGYGVYHSENYFNNWSDGFYNFASYGVNDQLTPLKPGHQPSVYFKGRYFNTVREVFDWLKTGIESQARLVDSLEYEDPPLRCLAYPLTVGAQWTYRYPGNPWHMEKAVIGRANQTVPAGDFDCFEIQWLYDLNDDGTWDDDIDIFDQISQIGLVKRSITIRGIVLEDPWSPEPLGYFDAKEEYVLTDYQQ
jgi:hypothetical protein